MMTCDIRVAGGEVGAIGEGGWVERKIERGFITP